MRSWGFAIALVLPAFLPLAGHYFGSIAHGLIPTGFVLYDMPYYWANARELSDDGGFHLFYGNPFSPDYTTPRVYFQPLTLLLGLMAKSGVDPGLAFTFVGAVGAILCGRLAIALYDRFADPSADVRVPGLIAFFWGGGLLAAAGLVFVAVRGGAVEGLFRFDPFGGWWFLNFGRNLVFPTEAVYHAIFFATILLTISRRYALALVAMTLMVVSHPFAGIQLLVIIIAWSGLETALRSGVVPRWFVEGTAVLAVIHLGYYLLFLNRFVEHRELQDQWTLRWLLPWKSLFLASVLVGGLAAWQVRTAKRARQVLSRPANRLLIVWFVVSVLLAKHELFVSRVTQPLHFTRGYQWIPLFLLGIPALEALLLHIRRINPRSVSFAAMAVFFVIMIGDNVTWFAVRTAQTSGITLPGLDRQPRPLGLVLKPDEAELLRWLDHPSNRGTVVAAEADTIGYLVTAYTPLRSWRSHKFNTPFTFRRDEELKAFFEGGVVPEEWHGLSILLVFRDTTDWRTRLGAFEPGRATVTFVNRSFIVGRVAPRG